MNEQESCVVNGGITTKNFKLEKSMRQCNPWRMLIKNKNIKGIKTFENIFLCNACEDDSSFFLKDKNSLKETLNTINYFSSFMGLNVKWLRKVL